MVMDLQYDINQINLLKTLIVHLSNGETDVQEVFESHFGKVDLIDILLLQYELVTIDQAVTMLDVKFFNEQILPLQNFAHNKNDLIDGHPLLIFQEEIDRFRIVLSEIEVGLDNTNPQLTEAIIEKMTSIGGLYNHFNRKEKVIFPILERYQFYTLPRTMWKEDDRIRGLYQAAMRRFKKIPQIDNLLVKQTFIRFLKAFKEMLLQEEFILQPIISTTFTSRDWYQIANESDAFGFAMGIVGTSAVIRSISGEQEGNQKTQEPTGNLPFGGGYLTLKEADLILNNLPIEITFVDKNGIFKYFNEKGKYGDMVLIRTPASIGRNVANCHPPKSMKKVMKLIRELKYSRRKSETMWFKKQDHFVHITYTAMFDDDGEYMGILECVQDIQPFFDLPQETKRAVRRLSKTE